MGTLMAVMIDDKQRRPPHALMGKVNRGVGRRKSAQSPELAKIADNTDGNQYQPQGKDGGQNHEHHNSRVRIGLEAEDKQDKRKDQSYASCRGQNHSRAADQILTEIDGGANYAAQFAENFWSVLAGRFRQCLDPQRSPWQALAKDGADSSTSTMLDTVQF